MRALEQLGLSINRLFFKVCYIEFVMIGSRWVKTKATVRQALDFPEIRTRTDRDHFSRQTFPTKCSGFDLEQLAVNVLGNCPKVGKGAIA